MNIGFIGLGKMGLGIIHRLLDANHTIFGYDPNEQARSTAHSMGITTVNRLEDLAAHVSLLWIMIPAGEAIENIITTLKPLLKPNSIIADSGSLSALTKFNNNTNNKRQENNLFFILFLRKPLS